MYDSLYSAWSGLFLYVDEIGWICVHGKMFEAQNKTACVQLSIHVCMFRFDLYVSELPFIYMCTVCVYQGQAHVCLELSACK